MTKKPKEIPFISFIVWMSLQYKCMNENHFRQHKNPKKNDKCMNSTKVTC